MLTMSLNQRSASDSVGGPERHKDQPKDPQVSAPMFNRWCYPTHGHCGALIYDVGETEDQQAPEVGRLSSPGPPGLVYWHLDQVPDLPT